MLELEYHCTMLLGKMYEEGCFAPNFRNMHDMTLLKYNKVLLYRWSWKNEKGEGKDNTRIKIKKKK